jgi:hypothetical protein
VREDGIWLDPAIVEPDCTRDRLIAQDAARKVLVSAGMARLGELRFVLP